MPARHADTVYLVTVFIVLIAACAWLLGALDAYTGGRIADNRELATRRIITDILPGDAVDDVFADPLQVTAPDYLGTETPVTVYRVRGASGPLGVVFYPVVAEGYNSRIALAVGITAGGTVSGVRVISEDETEGLGDQVHQQNTGWIETFAGRSFETTPMDEWAVGSEGGAFDAVSGATITSRAVINAVRNALSYHNLARGTLYREAPGGSGAPAANP